MGHCSCLFYCSLVGQRAATLSASGRVEGLNLGSSILQPSCMQSVIQQFYSEKADVADDTFLLLFSGKELLFPGT